MIELTKEQIKYRNAWARQLQWEHSQICDQYDIHLETPVIGITDSRKNFGTWNSEFATLGLSVHLVEKYPWDCIIEILKHEMAHQYVWEVLRQGRERHHGEAFQYACEKLAVHHGFRLATGKTPQIFLNPAEIEQDDVYNRMFSKVEKLFSLAKSANEHEAAQAMQRANALIRKYNLERIERRGASDYTYGVIELKKKKISRQQRMIAIILKDFFFVEVITSQQYDALADETYRTIELTGTKENVDIARYVYDFLVSRLEHLWYSFKKSTKVKGRQQKKSYHLGVIQGFSEKMKKEESQSHQNTQDQTVSSLVVAGDFGLQRYYVQRYPNMKTVRMKSLPLNRDTYAAGREEGRRLIIHKGIESRDGNKGKMLTHKIGC